MKGAAYFDLGITEYSAMELGRVPLAMKAKFAIAKLHPTLPELLRLARYRSGMRLKSEAAPRAGISHMTYLALEREAHPRIVNFYEKRGFTFP